MNTDFNQKQTYPQFLKFIAPSVMSMIFLSFYTTIDGFFVSRYVGADALAAINIVIPLTCVVFGIAVMLSTGSSALIGIKLGEGKKEEAKGLYSFVFSVVTILAIVLTILGVIFIDEITYLLGSTEILFPYVKTYGLITVLMTIAMMYKLFFEYYLRLDGFPNLAMAMSLLGLVLNVILDFLFIAVWDLGIMGAALGTAFSIAGSSLIGLFHFWGKKTNLKFTKPIIDFKYLFDACINGCSEMFTEFSTGITTYLFNIAILRFHGENGVAAMSIIIYMYYFFTSVYFGISAGISPVISYNYGAENKPLIKSAVGHSFLTIAWSSAAIFLFSVFFGDSIIAIFTNDQNVYNIAVAGLVLFSTAYLIIGVNIFMSALFTAIGNGKVSGVISILRALIFPVVNICILPRLLAVNGIWLTIPLAELCTVLFSIYFYKKVRNSLLH